MLRVILERLRRRLVLGHLLSSGSRNGRTLLKVCGVGRFRRVMGSAIISDIARLSVATSHQPLDSHRRGYMPGDVRRASKHVRDPVDSEEEAQASQWYTRGVEDRR